MSVYAAEPKPVPPTGSAGARPDVNQKPIAASSSFSSGLNEKAASRAAVGADAGAGGNLRMGGASAASSTSSTPPSASASTSTISRSIGSLAAMSMSNALPNSPAGSLPLQATDAYASLNRRQPAYSDPNARQQQSQAPYAPLPGALPASAHVLVAGSSSPGPSTPQMNARQQSAAAKAKGTPPPPPSAASKPPLPVSTRAGAQQQTPKKGMSPGGTIRMIANQTPGGTARIFVQQGDETDGVLPGGGGGAGQTLQTSQSFTGIGNVPVAASAARANGLAILPPRNADRESFKRQAEELREQYLRSHEERMGRIDVRIDSLHSVTASSSPSRTIADSARGTSDMSRFIVYDDSDDTTL